MATSLSARSQSPCLERTSKKMNMHPFHFCSTLHNGTEVLTIMSRTLLALAGYAAGV